jgi:hypothetical protein
MTVTKDGFTRAAGSCNAKDVIAFRRERRGGEAIRAGLPGETDSRPRPPAAPGGSPSSGRLGDAD